MIFSQDARKIFIDIDSEPVKTGEKLDIVLSPAFYWVKKVELPVTSLREVKKLLPSLFEDVLPAGNYSYRAYKSDGAFMIFAYDDKAILDKLAQKGVLPSQINAVYFAQSEFAQSEVPVAIDSESVMLSQEGVVLRLPRALVRDPKPLHLRSETSVKDRIDLEMYGHIADSKSVVGFMALLGILIAVFAVEWWMVSDKNSQLESRHHALFDEYSLKPTMLQNDAVLKRLESGFSSQMQIRNALVEVMALGLETGERMVRLDLEKDRIRALFETVSPERQKVLEAQLKRSGLRTKATLKSGVLSVEVAL